MTKPRAKVLIIDDSAVVREAAAAMLEDEGYDVAIVESAFSFAQALNTHKPDIVLMDVNMPAMSGDRVIAIAQKHLTLPCPVLLFSDRDPAVLSKLAAECGAAGFIQKTGNGPALAKAVASHLAKAAK